MHTGIKSQIKAISRATPTEEACGLIIAPFGGGSSVFSCINRAAKKDEEFEIAPEDYLMAEKQGDILGVYHSHPTSAGFSEADLECAEEIALPFYMYDVQGDTWHEYLPASYRPEILCQRWILGFQDCFSCTRWYYRKILKIHIDDYDRDESFDHEEKNVIMNNFEKENFELVSKSDLKLHDVILFKTDKALPQHFGVFIGNGQKFVHHLQNAFSREDILTDRWQARILYVLRHKSQIKKV